MFKVIKYFTDLQDNSYEYKVGDEYPRKGLEPTADRIIELSGSDNKRGEPLIKEIKTKGAAPKNAAPKKSTKK